MTIESISVPGETTAVVVATFGTARLIRASREALELHGGSREERAEAREWASLFLDAEYVAWHPSEHQP